MYLEPSQTYNMEFFAKIVNVFWICLCTMLPVAFLLAYDMMIHVKSTFQGICKICKNNRGVHYVSEWSVFLYPLYMFLDGRQSPLAIWILCGISSLGKSNRHVSHGHTKVLELTCPEIFFGKYLNFKVKLATFYISF